MNRIRQWDMFRSRSRTAAASTAFLALLLPHPGNAHEHKPPHQGALQVLGDEAAHVELVLDRDTGKLTAYVLDGEAENAVRIATPSLPLVIRAVEPAPGSGSPPATVELRAVPNVLTGETVGDTSQFEATVKTLQHVDRFEGTFPRVDVKGTRFADVAIYYPEGNEAHEAKHEEHAGGGS